ncbi:MAG: HD domain-containing protein [Chloroflexota bacterium]
MISVSKARRLYEGARAAHDFDHVVRVLRLATRIARAENADIAVVHAAALLHDIGRQEAERRGADHATVGVSRARRILSRLPGADKDQMEAILHAIAAHRYRTEPSPSTLEAQVVFDADKLDAIGAIGIARAFAYAGAHGQRLWVPIPSVDLDAWQRQGDDPHAHTPIHEYVVKLSHIKDALYTHTAQTIAEGRHEVMAAFIQRLGNEVQGVA